MSNATFAESLKEKRVELTRKTILRDDIAVERLPDTVDDVQLSADRELVIASLNRHWRTVREIDAALARIQDGSFGECGDCEEPIAEKRLRALPWARLCIRCQERRDEDGASGILFAA